MYMFKYVTKRLGLMLLTFFIIFTMCFVLIKLLPIPTNALPGQDPEIVMKTLEGRGWITNIKEGANGVWTYDLKEALTGLKIVLSTIKDTKSIQSVGISGMMHGYLAFDKEWNLLVPFRTWQNTITAQAAKKLTELFGFNIPQRWTVAHYYQAVLNLFLYPQSSQHRHFLSLYIIQLKLNIQK